MHELFIAVILGIVQGFTEFLPISSTGHLIITGSLLDIQNDPRIPVFEVVIQLGSILAVVVLYWRRFLGLLRPQKGVRFSGMYGLWLLFLTTVPASVVGFLAHNTIDKYLFNPISVAFALAVGGIAILVIEKRKTTPTHATLDDMTPKMALLIGCFQCFALWPGFSRSASTILGGLLLGAKRELAAEYSFMAAVPIMVAATGYSLLKSANNLHSVDIPFFLVGTLVSFLAALLAITLLIKLVSSISFKPFAWYRLLIAPIILWFWM